MICRKVEKLVVLLIYLWVWWSTSIIISIHVKAANDSLKPGDTLNASSELRSKQGKCYLYFNGFVNEADVYLTIYHIFANEKNIVWISDRNQPIIDPDSVVLSLNHTGVLKIESQYEKPIILYSPPQPTTNMNTLATLLDTCNFVLQQLHLNGTKSVLWQSFDYPFDTLFPTMKLGVNRKTGRNWSLVSRLTNSLATPGAFSLEWEPKARELIIRKRGSVCWKSGKLRNNGLFENIPEDVQRVYEYTIVSNSDEDSLTFKIKIKNYGVFPGWELLETGRLTSKEGEIAKADSCYGYNSDGGCQRWKVIPKCREAGDVFQRKMGSPRYANVTTKENTSYGYSDCRDICWSNCNCTGFKELNGNGTGCIFFLGNSTKDVYADEEDFDILVKPVKEVAPPHGSTFREADWDRP